MADFHRYGPDPEVHLPIGPKQEFPVGCLGTIEFQKIVTWLRVITDQTSVQKVDR